MTLWFDVTDLKIWHLPQLTGIQRTVVGVLAELLAVRTDMRLFAYDHVKGVLEEVDGTSLPESIRRHFGDRFRANEPAVPSPLERDALDSRTPAASALASPGPRSSLPHQPSLPETRKPRLLWLRLALRRGAVALLERCRDEDIRGALRDVLRGSKNLLLAVYRRLIRRRHIMALPAAASAAPLAIFLPPPSSKACDAAPKHLLFQPGDVCLSLSGTWGLPGYGEAIARNKRNGSVKCINLIYDLIPTLYPQWLPPGISRLVTLWARQQIVNADIILTISEFQKREIEGYLAEGGLPVRRVDVIRLGDNPPLLRQLDKRALPLPRYVPEKKFVLCVSTLDVRKNHQCLYQVWRRLALELGEDCPKLLLIGVVHLFVKDLLYQIRHDRVVNRLIVDLSEITDEELAWYYKNCLFTVYPSMYEGWGLPVSESLAAGRYCITGNAASLPEAGGNLVDYFDPMDYVACHRLVHRAVTDPDYVRQCEERIRASYSPSTWRMTADRISSLVDELPKSSTSVAPSASIEPQLARIA